MIMEHALGWWFSVGQARKVNVETELFVGLYHLGCMLHSTGLGEATIEVWCGWVHD